MAVKRRRPKSFFSSATPFLVAGCLAAGLLVGRLTAGGLNEFATTSNALLDVNSSHNAAIRGGKAPGEQEAVKMTHSLDSSPYKSPFLKTYPTQELDQLNTEAAENQRAQERHLTTTNYLHQELSNGFPYLKLVLRTMTVESIFEQPQIHEPFLSEQGNRGNGGCDQGSPKCILTWDGWARAMATGDVLYDAIRRQVPGDVVEVGVFKGGMAAYLQALLMAMGETSRRKVWLVDSFKGLPPTSLMVSAADDSGSANNNSTEAQKPWAGQLSVGLQTVQNNLDRMGLLDPGNVGFLEGYVQHSLPNWNESQEIAVLRIDVDIYAATYDALHYLYPRLSRGGAVLFDDWKFEFSREAVINYRKKHGITTPVQFLNGTVDPMAYWIKQ